MAPQGQRAACSPATMRAFSPPPYPMDSRQILAEIREANISYLVLAQTLLRADRAAALERLGIGDETARVIERLTPSQVMQVAASNTLLCRFRAGDDLVWDLITQHGVLDDTGARRA